MSYANCRLRSLLWKLEHFSESFFPLVMLVLFAALIATDLLLLLTGKRHQVVMRPRVVKCYVEGGAK